MSRHLALLLCTLTLLAGCSRDPERSSATAPTPLSAPNPGSLLGPTSVAPGGISGKFDVDFPGRDQSFDFRNLLEIKYVNSLGRSAAPTFVDREGEVVWTQEYMRYRTNGCDHGTSVQRVIAQIDGQPAGGVCGAPPDGLIAFPPRTDSFDFRRTLESKYQQFGRGASQSAVDAEGGVVWTQEYLRYRVNQCDHPTSVQRVFTQIDGGGVQPTCFVPPCMFTVAPRTQSVPAVGGQFTTVVTRSSGENCTYGAESLASFISIAGGASGTAATNTVTYNVLPNLGGARSGLIRVRWTNNSTLLDVNQDAAPFFTMVDPNAGPGATTICQIKTASTTCMFSVSGNFSGTPTFTWAASYTYGTGVTHNQTGTNPNFQFTQTCGGTGSTPAGTETPLTVTLTITDANGTITLVSGMESQAPLIIKFFTC